MRRFYLDPIFHLMLLCPVPVWIFLYFQTGFLDSIEIKIFLTLVLVYPILEEIIFRGFLQPILAKHLHHSWSVITSANLLTSLVFSLTHLINHPPLWSLATFIPSLALCYIMELAKNINAQIHSHCTSNSASFLFLCFH